jgi:transposase
MGIARFATLSNGAVFEPVNTLSNGAVFEPVNSFRKKQPRLARYQRAMARKPKFSNNWKKAKAKVTRPRGICPSQQRVRSINLAGTSAPIHPRVPASA